MKNLIIPYQKLLMQKAGENLFPAGFMATQTRKNVWKLIQN